MAIVSTPTTLCALSATTCAAGTAAVVISTVATAVLAVAAARDPSRLRATGLLLVTTTAETAQTTVPLPAAT